jgi:hypothetical protein
MEERPFELVFQEAYHRMMNDQGAYFVTVMETKGMIQNLFDYDPQTNRFRHYKHSTDPTMPYNPETGSKDCLKLYRPEQLAEFRRDMMLTTRSALQGQNVQYYQPGKEVLIDNTGFPLALITYPNENNPEIPLPSAKKQNDDKPKGNKKKISWWLIAVLFIIIAFALLLNKRSIQTAVSTGADV